MSGGRQLNVSGAGAREGKGKEKAEGGGEKEEGEVQMPRKRKRVSEASGSSERTRQVNMRWFPCPGCRQVRVSDPACNICTRAAAAFDFPVLCFCAFAGFFGRHNTSALTCDRVYTEKRSLWKKFLGHASEACELLYAEIPGQTRGLPGACQEAWFGQGGGGEGEGDGGSERQEEVRRRLRMACFSLAPDSEDRCVLCVRMTDSVVQIDF